MSRHTKKSSAIRLKLAFTIFLVTPQLALAALVSLATAPLTTSTTSTVQPNILFVLDNSGSMDWDHMPDDASDGGSAVPFRFGFYGLRSSQCNQVYYNPAIIYTPPIKADGTRYPDSSFTAASTNGFITGSSTVNLSSNFIASNALKTDSTGHPAYYYKYSGAQTTQAQKNYHDTTNTFYSECSDDNGISYSSGKATTAPPASGVGGIFTRVDVSATSGLNGTDERTNFANWYSYYRTRMLMMKTATGQAFSSLDNKYRVGIMKYSSSTPVQYVDSFELTHRANWYNSLYTLATSGSTPSRRALSNAGRYFAGMLGGADPLQYSCQQNFSILASDGYWNSGDPVDIGGSAFPADDNQDAAAARPMYDGAVPIGKTNITITYTHDNYSSCRSNSCSSGESYKIQPEIGSCTVAVAGAPTGTESCSPSWSSNGNATYSSCSSNCSKPSQDPSASIEISRVEEPYTSSTGGSKTPNNLADIAMYYYQTDLRTSTLSNCTGAVAGEDVCTNNVFIGSNDNQTQQHMTTFTLGLGASGWMNYSPSYLTDISGDFFAVKMGSTASSTVCKWQAAGTTCNWPLPGMDSSNNGFIANIDDLWHAAVDGRGAYFSATDPKSLSDGLSNALYGINARKGTGSAAATSTLNPVQGNNTAFIASYTTVSWKGNLEARGINTDSGAVSTNALWCAENVIADSCSAPGVVTPETSDNVTVYYCVKPNAVTCADGILVGTDCKVPVATSCTGTMNSRVGDISDTRTIKTANSTGSGLTDFVYSALTSAQQSYFADSTIGGLSQWSTLTPAQQNLAAGGNLVKYLRGQYGFEDRTSNADRLFRQRDARLGDIVESRPTFVKSPPFDYPYSGYSSFKSAQMSRAGTVYVGANDGMLHAFDTDGLASFNNEKGHERWAYIPSMVIPNMWKLADFNYPTDHVNLVNGSPIIGDICTANCTNDATAIWKTILVAGLGAGGKGYYALDITDPANPSLLWEFTTTSGMGKIQDPDIGYGFASPVITQKLDGTWVVLLTSGYNNVSPGNGIGSLYVLNAATGNIISKISTGVGNTSTPSGLAKIAVWNDGPANGNRAGYTYGGDLLGNVWRFDINSPTAAIIGNGAVMKLAALYSDTAGFNPQPVTTTPVLGEISGKRVVFIGTGKYLENGDLTTTQIQSQYAIKDDDATTTLINPRNSLVKQTLSNSASGSASRNSTGNVVNFYTGRGWYLDYPDVGERVNIDSSLVNGILVVPSLIPSGTACSPGGYGWLNYFDYKTGGASNSINEVSRKYNSPIVGFLVLFIDKEPVVEVVTADNPTPQEAHGIISSASPAFIGKRVIWRELIQ